MKITSIFEKYWAVVYSEIKMNKKIIPVFAINLKSRKDRRKFILSQFVDKEEFQFHLVEAQEHNVGAKELWLTFRHILKDLVGPEDEYIILCQDDHLFTREYSKEHLLHCINKARTLNADFLSCGISGFTSAIKVSDNLYWVEKFSGLQFTVVFRKFFQKILETDFETVSAADLKLCELTENKFFIYPFLSIQKEFGYSDVTAGNNIHGHVDNAFKDCNEKVSIINTVSTFYKQKLKATAALKSFAGIENVVIPFYIIHLNETTENLSATENQFEGRHEFAVTIIEGCQQSGKEFSLWISLKKIIKTAIENDDEVIIICREGHQFTKHYERNHFVALIWQAGVLGCNILISGMAAFNLALPITDDIFWIDSFHSSHFFVIYKSFYSDILQETFCDSDTLESKFSEMTSSKMALHPFISEEKNSKAQGINYKDNLEILIAENSIANERLLKLKNAWNRFNNQIDEKL